jgi:hypothetical protein
VAARKQADQNAVDDIVLADDYLSYLLSNFI